MGLQRVRYELVTELHYLNRIDLMLQLLNASLLQILLLQKCSAVLEITVPPIEQILWFHNTMITRQLTGLPRWHSGKESACQCRRHKRCGFDPWGRKIPWRRKWQPTPIFLPGKFHGQRSMAGYSPWGRKEHIYTGTTVDYTNTALYLYGAYDFQIFSLLRSD